jgi:hypothetical protein
MNKEQKELIKLIDKAYSELSVLNNITWTQYRENLFDLNKKEELAHRRFTDSRDYEVSVSVCAKMFVVKHIAECLLSPNQYTFKDILILKKSIPLSCSLVLNYGDKIKEAWKDQDIQKLSKLDYICLVNYEYYKEQQKKRVA